MCAYICGKFFAHRLLRAVKYIAPEWRSLQTVWQLQLIQPLRTTMYIAC